MKQKIITTSIGLGALLLILGGIYATFFGVEMSHENHQSANTVWTCSMHPQIKMPSPGKCPMCGMELIPLKLNNDDSGSVHSLKLSPRAQKLAEVKTTPVRKGEARLDISLYGKLELDESRVAHITSRTSGRIERLFLDFTGMTVNKGEVDRGTDFCGRRPRPSVGSKGFDCQPRTPHKSYTAFTLKHHSCGVGQIRNTLLYA